MAYERLNNLQGQVAVVTGARKGVGFAVAEKLKAAGAQVVALVRQDADALQARLGEGHQVFEVDVRDSNRLKEIASQISTCDILVNCAGASKNIGHKNLEALTDELFDEMLQVNLRSVFTVIRAFAPLLQKSPHGLIVNIGSAAAVRTGGSNLAYAAAKAGLESLGRNLAVALAPVRVVTISPSALDTGFTSQPPEFYGKVAATTPLKQVGTVDDVANAVEAVATTMRFMTGNTILLDGGRTL